MRALLWVVVVWLTAPPVLAERADDLRRLREAVRGRRDRVAEYEEKGRGLLDAIDAIDRTVLALGREVSASRRLADEAKNTLATIESESARLLVALDRTEAAMSVRAVGLYKAGEAGTLRMLFSAGGLRDFLSRVTALRLLLVHDSELLQRHRRQSADLKVTEQRALGAEERWTATVFELTERRTELGTEREAKRLLIARVYADRTRERAALIELETAGRALEETLDNLAERPTADSKTRDDPATSFEARRGQMEPPVAGRIAKAFGRQVDTRFNTETFNRGVEFSARTGTGVRSVAPGNVRFAGWFSGYGQLVIVDHGDDYFTVFGHLEKIDVEPGSAVARGQRIGTVGETGSLEGPKLYFEVRRGGQPLDPREWLAMGRRR